MSQEESRKSVVQSYDDARYDFFFFFFLSSLFYPPLTDRNSRWDRYTDRGSLSLSPRQEGLLLHDNDGT